MQNKANQVQPLYTKIWAAPYARVYLIQNYEAILKFSKGAKWPILEKWLYDSLKYKSKIFIVMPKADGVKRACLCIIGSDYRWMSEKGPEINTEHRIGSQYSMSRYSDDRTPQLGFELTKIIAMTESVEFVSKYGIHNSYFEINKTLRLIQDAEEMLLDYLKG